MEYTFSWGSFCFGLIILITSGAFVIFHNRIADYLGAGVSSYSRYKLYGLIACGVGIVIMLSLHTLILSGIVNLLFGGFINS